MNINYLCDCCTAILRCSGWWWEESRGLTYQDRGYVTLPTANHCARSCKGPLHSSLSLTWFILYIPVLYLDNWRVIIYPMLFYLLCSYSLCSCLIFYCVLCSCLICYCVLCSYFYRLWGVICSAAGHLLITTNHVVDGALTIGYGPNMNSAL